MKTYSITEGAFSHARTSIAHDRDWRNRKLNRDGRTDPRSGSASDARGIEASDQAMGRAEPHVSTLWGKAAPPGRNDAPGDRDDFRTRGGATTALSLSRVWAPVVPSQCLVRQVEGRNHQCALARSSDAGRVFLAVSSGEQPPKEAERSPNQCGRDPFADQSAGPATGRATARGSRTRMLLSGWGCSLTRTGPVP